MPALAQARLYADHLGRGWHGGGGRARLLNYFDGRTQEEFRREAGPLLEQEGITSRVRDPGRVETALNTSPQRPLGVSLSISAFHPVKLPLLPNSLPSHTVPLNPAPEDAYGLL